MTINVHAKRWVVGFMLAALTLTTMAPLAEAKQRSKRGRGHHKTRVVERTVYRPVYSPPRRVVHVHRSGDGGSALAGFIGGIVVGAVLSSAGRSYGDYDRYDYYDPYCGRRYDSLRAYHAHCGSQRHTRIVRVIDVRRDRCVETMRWDGDHWRHWEDDRYSDYRDRYRDRDYDRDYDDDDYDYDD